MAFPFVCEEHRQREGHENMSEGPTKLCELCSWTFPWLFHCNFDQLDEQAHSLVLTAPEQVLPSVLFCFSLPCRMSEFGVNTTGEQGHIINNRNKNPFSLNTVICI